MGVWPECPLRPHLMTLTTQMGKLEPMTLRAMRKIPQITIKFLAAQKRKVKISNRQVILEKRKVEGGRGLNPFMVIGQLSILEMCIRQNKN